MNLAVGDTVVYGVHGAGLVAARETRQVESGQEVVIVLALAQGLSVELPLARAEELLRPPADAAEIGRLAGILRSPGELDPDPWLKRQRTTRAKLGTTAPGLAEIIRDGASRDTLSPTERELVRRARDLLAGEIALSRGEDTDTACAWIDEQLAGAEA